MMYLSLIFLIFYLKCFESSMGTACDSVHFSGSLFLPSWWYFYNFCLKILSNLSRLVLMRLNIFSLCLSLFLDCHWGRRECGSSVGRAHDFWSGDG